MKNLTFLIALLFSAMVCHAQVGIGNTDPNATLDISASNSATPSNEDGILIPRIDEFPLTNPTIAQDGLMVFVSGNGTPAKGFYYWESGTSSWELLAGAKSINDLLDGRSDNDGTDNGSSIFIGEGAGASDNQTHNRNLGIGYNSLTNTTNGSINVGLGYNTLFTNTNGFANTGIGFEALYTNTGNGNTGIGFHTLYNNTSGSDNIAIGFDTMYHHSTGNSNTAIGSQALRGNISGANNGAYGRYSLEQNTNGNNNVALGHESLRLNSTGSGNVGLGYQAGYNETGSNKLYIENSASTSPLVYGEFDTNLLRINGTLNINNAYSLPTTDGAANQVLQTNGSGTISWNTPTASDTDWVESGTNIYKTNGNVSIGTTFVPYKLYVTDNDPSNTSVVGLNNSYTGSGSVRSFNNVLTHTGTGTAQSYALFSYFNKPPGTANSGDTTANYGYAYNRYGGAASSDSYGAYNIGFKSGGTSGNAYGSTNFAYNEFGNISYGVYASATGGGVNYAGYFAGDIFVGGSYIPSAAKLKRNIINAPSSIDRLKSIRIHQYQYKDDSYDYMHLPSGVQTGFIAEEFGMNFPELTKKTIQPKAAKELVEAGIERDHGDIEFTAVNYTGLIPHLVNGFQEQQTTIEQQHEKIKILEEKLLALEKKIQGH